MYEYPAEVLAWWACRFQAAGEAPYPEAAIAKVAQAQHEWGVLYLPYFDEVHRAAIGRGVCDETAQRAAHAEAQARILREFPDKAKLLYPEPQVQWPTREAPKPRRRPRLVGGRIDCVPPAYEEQQRRLRVRLAQLHALQESKPPEWETPTYTEDELGYFRRAQWPETPALAEASCAFDALRATRALAHLRRAYRRRLSKKPPLRNHNKTFRIKPPRVRRRLAGPPIIERFQGWQGWEDYRGIYGWRYDTHGNRLPLPQVA